MTPALGRRPDPTDPRDAPVLALLDALGGCPFCGSSTQRAVRVAGHVQCGGCKAVIARCCDD